MKHEWIFVFNEQRFEVMLDLTMADQHFVHRKLAGDDPDTLHDQDSIVRYLKFYAENNRQQNLEVWINSYHETEANSTWINEWAEKEPCGFMISIRKHGFPVYRPQQ